MVNFLKAMEWMEQGHKVRVSSWGNEKYFWYVPDWDKYTFDNLWCIKQPDGDNACFIRSWIHSEDWVKCDELEEDVKGIARRLYFEHKSHKVEECPEDCFCHKIAEELSLNINKSNSSDAKEVKDE